MSNPKRYTRCGMSIVEDKKGGWVEYSDYAALEAERERLRAQVSALQSDANSWQSGYDKGREDGAKAAEGWKAQHARDSAELRRLCAERDALRDELAKWERSFREIHEPALRDAHAYIQELRAELAEVKGREAACFVVGKLEKTAVIAPPLPVGTKLYALPPASPDVEGLVKALEQAIADIEDWAAYASPYFQEKHDLAGCLEKHRTALSTWRQAQEGKP